MGRTLLPPATRVLRPLIALFLTACAAFAATPALAQSETRTITVLAQRADPAINALTEAYQSATGVRVVTIAEPLLDAAAIRSRLGAGDIDVLWLRDPLLAPELANSDHLAPLTGEHAAAAPATQRDADANWIVAAHRARVFVVNSDHAIIVERPGGERSEPRSIYDAWNPTLGDGAFLFARPEHGSMRAHLGAFLTVTSPIDVTRWAGQMQRQRVRIVEDEHQVVRAVGTLEALSGFTDSDIVEEGKRNGWPVRGLLMRHDLADRDGNVANPIGPVLVPMICARPANAPSPALADAFIEFALGESAQRMLGETPGVLDASGAGETLEGQEPAPVDTHSIIANAREGVSRLHIVLPH
ncbi:MAG: hypothetical protein EA379_02965 [Phycisphaerales bacterium]|nr:MAG: hypothetical protein EA379_02965 [Phycisphaerales bacterium]